MHILRHIARHMRIMRKAADQSKHIKLEAALLDAGLPIRGALDGCQTQEISRVTACRKDVVTASLKLVV